MKNTMQREVWTRILSSYLLVLGFLAKLLTSFFVVFSFFGWGSRSVLLHFWQWNMTTWMQFDVPCPFSSMCYSCPTCCKIVSSKLRMRVPIRNDNTKSAKSHKTRMHTYWTELNRKWQSIESELAYNKWYWNFLMRKKLLIEGLEVL